jgi:hypothetical protein
MDELNIITATRSALTLYALVQLHHGRSLGVHCHKEVFQEVQLIKYL